MAKISQISKEKSIFIKCSVFGMGNADFELLNSLINIGTEKGVYVYSIDKYDEI